MEQTLQEFINWLNEDENVDYIVETISTTPIPEIQNVIFKNPATIVFWDDGTKTVVKAQGDDVYDKEKGLALCFFKKMHGNTGSYFDIIKKFVN